MIDYQIVWRGPISYVNGWGIASGEYVLALDRLGVDIKIEALSESFTQADPNKASRFKYLMNKPYATDKPQILIYHYPPYNINLQEERNKFTHIMINTAWETTRIPQNWFPTINEFDAVCVPSRQNSKAMQDSGVKAPIFLVPHGADTDFFTPENEKLQISNANGKFVFVSVFDFQHRKNPEGLLKAYWEEFKSDENVMLLIKTYWRGNGHMGHQIRNNISEYKKKLGLGDDTAPLCLVTNTLERKMLKGIYTAGNVFVLPSRGEGVGLPFIEALSSGLSVISTGWGGQLDFLHEGNSFLVDFNLENPVERMNHAISPDYRPLFAEPGQLWAEPNINSLRKQMRVAYENPPLCKQKGEQGRKDMLNHSWNRAGVALKQAVEKLVMR